MTKIDQIAHFIRWVKNINLGFSYLQIFQNPQAWLTKFLELRGFRASMNVASKLECGLKIAKFTFCRFL